MGTGALSRRKIHVSSSFTRRRMAGAGGSEDFLIKYFHIAFLVGENQLALSFSFKHNREE